MERGGYGVFTMRSNNLYYSRIVLLLVLGHGPYVSAGESWSLVVARLC